MNPDSESGSGPGPGSGPGTRLTVSLHSAPARNPIMIPGRHLSCWLQSVADSGSESDSECQSMMLLWLPVALGGRIPFARLARAQIAFQPDRVDSDSELQVIC